MGYIPRPPGCTSIKGLMVSIRGYLGFQGQMGGAGKEYIRAFLERSHSINSRMGRFKTVGIWM